MKKIILLILTFLISLPVFAKENLSLKIENGKYNYCFKNSVVFVADEGQEPVGDIAVVKVGNKWGMINKKGKQIVPFKYDYLGKPSEGRLVFINKLNDEYYIIGYLNKKGQTVIKPKKTSSDIFKFKNTDFLDFHQKLVAVWSEDDLWGYMDKKGKIKINPVYKKVEPFSDGYAAVSEDGELFGYINKKDNYIIKPRFYEIEENKGCMPFFEDYTFVALNKERNAFAIINKEGITIKEFEIYLPVETKKSVE